MEIGIIGTGAVGGYFGAKLVKAGYNVTFIGTEPSVEIIKKHGLHIKSVDRDIKIENPSISYELMDIKNADIILLCTKSYHTEEIAESIKDTISDKTIIISFQNGIENENILASALGKERIIAASIYLLGESTSPGMIEHKGSGRIILGEMNQEITPRIKELETLFLNADIPTSVSTNLIKDMWKKLILNSALNGMTAAIGKNLKKINSISEAKQAYFDILKEGQIIAESEGINITDEEIEKIFQMLKQETMLDFKSSTLQDLEKGKPLEIDSLQGTIIKIAEKHNIKAPLNNLIYSLIKLKTAK